AAAAPPESLRAGSTTFHARHRACKAPEEVQGAARAKNLTGFGAGCSAFCRSTVVQLGVRLRIFVLPCLAQPRRRGRAEMAFEGAVERCFGLVADPRADRCDALVALVEAPCRHQK